MEIQRLLYKILTFICIFYCVASGSNNVRLHGSANPWEGIVEVFYNGTWGTICNSYRHMWNGNNGDVVCRELGYFRSRVVYWYDNYNRVNTSMPIWFYRVSCTGQESTLFNCSYRKYSSIGYPYCSHYRDAAVKCLNITRAKINGNCNFEFLDMCNYTQDTKGFDETDWVLQRGGMHSVRGVPYTDHTFMSSDGYYVTVKNRRARLLSPVITSKRCLSFYHNFYGYRSSYVKTLKVYLKYSNSFPKMVWRLQKSSSSGWSLGQIPLNGSSVQVIFEGASPQQSPTYSSQGSVSLDDITVSTSPCTLHPVDAKVTYEESSSEIRLVGGTNSSGRVQVFHNKQWGRVCGDYNWGIKEANVVCRYLGFEKAEAAITSNVFGKGKGFILLQRVRCSGVEPSLSQCTHDGWEHVTSCGGYSRGDASVICRTSTNYDIRLNASDTPYQGKVEVNVGGLWFAVDEQEWDIRDGNVACRQLGYAGANGVTVADSTSSHKGFSHLKCQGNETSLQQCNHTSMQFSSYTRDAAVKCYGLRLTGGKSEMEGRVEVQYDGVWGTVCNKNWDKRDADVVCRTLGFDQASAQNCCPKFGEGTGSIVVDDAQCNGNEISFSFCKIRGWGLMATDCTHAQDVGVSCVYTIELSKIKIVLEESQKEWNKDLFVKNVVDMLNKYCSVKYNCGNYTSENQTWISKKDVELSELKHDPLYPNRLLVELSVRAYLQNGKAVSLSNNALFNAIKSEKTLAGYNVLFVDNQQLKHQHHNSKDNTKSTPYRTIIIVVVVVVGVLLISVLIYFLVRRRRMRTRINELRTQDHAYTALLNDDQEDANADIGELLVPPIEAPGNTGPEA